MLISLVKTIRYYWLLVIVFVSLFPVYIYVVNPALTPGRVLPMLFPFLFFFTLLNYRIRKITINSILFHRKIFLYLLMYFVFRLLSVSKSVDSVYSIALVYLEFCQVFVSLLIGFILVEKDNKELKYNLKIILQLILTLVSIYTVLEFFMSSNPLAKFADADSKAGATAAAIKFRDSFYRAQAFFENPLSLAHFVSLIVPVIILLRNNSLPIFLIFSIFIFSILTGSRALTLIIFLSLALVYLKNVNFKSKLMKVPIVLVGFICFILLIFLSVQSQSAAEISSSYTRLIQWRVAFDFIGSNIFLGVGPGNAELLFEFSETLHRQDRLWKATIDSYYLLRLVESGFFAFIFFIFFILHLCLCIYRTLPENELSETFSKYMLLFSFLFMLVSSLYTVYPICFLLIGYVIACYERIEKVASSRRV